MLVINEPYASRIRARRDNIRDYLLQRHPELREQKHLDAGTVERAYWHYGYMIALSDVLCLDGKTVDQI